MTLRQLFYRLVSVELLPNTQPAYKTLSDRTAKARRAGTFPGLIDRGRGIYLGPSWDSPADALTALAEQYRRDRTQGQPFSVYLAVEKAGIVEQLRAWFGDLGVPIVALSGYASQSYVDRVAERVARQGDQRSCCTPGTTTRLGRTPTATSSSEATAGTR